jgi:predicted TIM-barrel fold metal-dependent hydrolase
MHQGQATKTVYGYPRTFAEWHMSHPHATMCQLYSFVFNGVFDEFPDLRLCLLEAGFTWLPHSLWRMDEHYKAFRAETPWVKRMPSDHVRDHVVVATQPKEEISAKHLLDIVDMVGSDRLIVYSSDYPHYDFDPPDRILPKGTPEDLKQKILYQNAKDFYRFAAL